MDLKSLMFELIAMHFKVGLTQAAMRMQRADSTGFLRSDQAHLDIIRGSAGEQGLGGDDRHVRVPAARFESWVVLEYQQHRRCTS